MQSPRFFVAVAVLSWIWYVFVALAEEPTPPELPCPPIIDFVDYSVPRGPYVERVVGQSRYFADLDLGDMVLLPYEPEQ